MLEPYLPLCAQLGRLAMSLAEQSVGRPDRGRLPRPPGRLRHPPADARGAERRVPGPGRGERQLRQRAGDRRGARHPGQRVEGERVARLREPGRRSRCVADGERVEVAGTTIGPRHVPHLVSRLRPELQHRAGAAPGDLPLLGRARDDRQGRHGARRARHQHRLDRGRARARPRARRARRAAAPAATP